MGLLNQLKFYKGRLFPEVQPDNLLYTIFGRKGTPRAVNPPRHQILRRSREGMIYDVISRDK